MKVVPDLQASPICLGSWPGTHAPHWTGSGGPVLGERTLADSQFKDFRVKFSLEWDTGLRAILVVVRSPKGWHGREFQPPVPSLRPHSLCLSFLICNGW